MTEHQQSQAQENDKGARRGRTADEFTPGEATATDYSDPGGLATADVEDAVGEDAEQEEESPI